MCSVQQAQRLPGSQGRFSRPLLSRALQQQDLLLGLEPVGRTLHTTEHGRVPFLTTAQVQVIAQCQHCQAWHKLADAANLVEEIRYADLEDE